MKTDCASCRPSDGRKNRFPRSFEALELSQPLVSHHLKELRRSHLLKVEREGPFVYYEITNNGILSLLARLNAMAEEIIASHEPF